VIVWVVAVALINENGEILVQKRPPGRSMAGLWEFPGGKIEPGETAEAALVRELDEELGINVSESDLVPLSFASAPLADHQLMLLLYVCRQWRGTAQPLDAETISWVVSDGLSALAMPPADAPLVTALQQALRS
jgi:8-oxo-dGTP diphosphatase